ncbi:translation protein SH3-like domain-containing protein [Blastocladiella britannica]|nr:translation protein SH3-like domain-containing protein [Blastocladiella britannica]
MSKYHKMATQRVWKLSGINLVQPRPRKTQPKDTFDKWSIYTHDTVQIMSGENAGERGKVIRIDRKNNLVFVEGKKTVKKHIPVTPQTPQGGTFSMESGIHVSNVSLVDPHQDVPTRVRFELVKDETTEKMVRRRLSRRTGLEIPRPAFDPTEMEKARKKDNSVDTLLDAVKEQTYFPSLANPPLPGDLRLKNHGLW